MKGRPVTVVETHAFRRAADKIWKEGAVAELVDHVARNPESGDLIPGTGGVRKLRWARPGGGKRGGARVVYFYFRSDAPLYLLLAYAKSVATDLTPEEKKAVAALARAITTAHTRGDR